MLAELSRALRGTAAISRRRRRRCPAGPGRAVRERVGGEEEGPSPPRPAAWSAALRRSRRGGGRGRITAGGSAGRAADRLGWRRGGRRRSGLKVGNFGEQSWGCTPRGRGWGERGGGGFTAAPEPSAPVSSQRSRSGAGGTAAAASWAPELAAEPVLGCYRRSVRGKRLRPGWQPASGEGCAIGRGEGPLPGPGGSSGGRCGASLNASAARCGE